MRWPWTTFVEKARKRRDDRDQMDFTREIFGPRPPEMINGWDRLKLLDMIASGDLSPRERVLAEGRLRIVEQEDGPAGTSARAATWAMRISVGSIVIAAIALLKSFNP